MRSDPTKDLRRFLGRAFTPGRGQGSTAPWWARWLLESVIWLVGLSAIAWLVDWAWFGAPVVQCWFLGLALAPFGLAAPAGLVLIVIGLLVAVAGARSVGITLLVIGALLGALPDLGPGLGLAAVCA